MFGFFFRIPKNCSGALLFGILLFWKMHFSFQFNREFMFVRKGEIYGKILSAVIYDMIKVNKQNAHTSCCFFFLSFACLSMHLKECFRRVLSTTLWDGSVMHLLFSSFVTSKKTCGKLLSININRELFVGINYFSLCLKIFRKASCITLYHR